jgi:hypothetical protein
MRSVKAARKEVDPSEAFIHENPTTSTEYLSRDVDSGLLARPLALSTSTVY